MNERDPRQWRRLFELQKGLFFPRIIEFIKENDVEPVLASTEFLMEQIFYLHEHKLNDELEEMLHNLYKVVKEMMFLKNVAPGMYVAKGRFETLLKFLENIHRTTPRLDWISRLKGKYDSEILVYLYHKNVDRMSRIADHLNIQPPQLTEIVAYLEQEGFVKRDREGKNVWCTLTKKGFLLGKYLNKSQGTEQAVHLVRKLVPYIQNNASSEDLNHFLNEYLRRNPEMYSLIQALKELSVTKLNYHTPVESSYPAWGGVHLDVADFRQNKQDEVGGYDFCFDSSESELIELERSP